MQDCDDAKADSILTVDSPSKDWGRKLLNLQLVILKVRIRRPDPRVIQTTIFSVIVLGCEQRRKDGNRLGAGVEERKSRMDVGFCQAEGEALRAVECKREAWQAHLSDVCDGKGSTRQVHAACNGISLYAQSSAHYMALAYGLKIGRFAFTILVMVATLPTNEFIIHNPITRL